MNDLFDVLKTSVLALPLWARLIILPVIIAFFIFIKKLAKKQSTKSNIILILKKIIRRVSERDLLTHDLFLNLELYKESIKQLDFGDTDRNYIFKTILISKMDTIKETTETFIKTKHINKWDTKCLAKALLKLSNSIMVDYDRKILTELSSKYEHLDYAKIFEIVMNGEHGFNVYHSSNIRYLINTIEIISSSNVPDNNIERVILYIETLDTIAKNAIFDAEKMFKNLNGNLSILLNVK